MHSAAAVHGRARRPTRLPVIFHSVNKGPPLWTIWFHVFDTVVLLLATPPCKTAPEGSAAELRSAQCTRLCRAVRRKRVCGTCVLQAGVTALLAVSSVLGNQQYVSILNRHLQTETRLKQGYMLPGLMKVLRPGAHRSLTLSFPLHQWFGSYSVSVCPKFVEHDRRE